MSKLKALIAGSTGYIGIQLIKLLLKHNNIKIKFLCGNSSVGKSLSYYDKSLKKYQLPKIKKFKREFLKDVDVISDPEQIKKDFETHFWNKPEAITLQKVLKACKNQCYKCHKCDDLFGEKHVQSILEA